MAWSPDGLLASASDDKTVIIWDLENGTPTQTLEGHAESINSVAWSPDGVLTSASDDGTITIWDLDSGTPAQTLEGHAESINSVAWSPDGVLASASDDGTITIWDLDSDTPAQTLEGHAESINSVAWSPDGVLASASDDTNVILIPHWIFSKPTCDFPFRNFTQTEWQDYMGTMSVYKPTCPNLPTPPIAAPLLTLRGRLFLAGGALLGLLLLFLLVKGFWQPVKREWTGNNER